MGRVGRKPKKRNRKPSGRLVQKRPKADEIKATVIAQRLKLVSEALATDERAGYPLGILAITKPGPKDKPYLTQAQFAAGSHWAGIVYEYRRIQGIPSDAPKACIFDGPGGAPLTGEIEDHVIARINRRYNDSYEALIAVGRPAHLVVNQVCVSDIMPLGVATNDLFWLRRGLDALAAYYGMI